MKKFKLLMIAFILLVSLRANAQWVKCDGIYGGNVSSLAVSGNNIFAGTSGSGFYLSTNNGSTWTQTAMNNQIVYQ